MSRNSGALSDLGIEAKPNARSSTLQRRLQLRRLSIPPAVAGFFDEAPGRIEMHPGLFTMIPFIGLSTHGQVQPR